MTAAKLDATAWSGAAPDGAPAPAVTDTGGDHRHTPTTCGHAVEGIRSAALSRRCREAEDGEADDPRIEEPAAALVEHFLADPRTAEDRDRPPRPHRFQGRTDTAARYGADQRLQPGTGAGPRPDQRTRRDRAPPPPVVPPRHRRRPACRS